MNHIEESWTSLSKVIFPEGSTPSDSQLYHMRKAYFSGAFIVVTMLNGLKRSGAAQQCMNQFLRELENWKNECLSELEN